MAGGITIALTGALFDDYRGLQLALRLAIHPGGASRSSAARASRAGHATEEAEHDTAHADTPPGHESADLSPVLGWRRPAAGRQLSAPGALGRTRGGQAAPPSPD